MKLNSDHGTEAVDKYWEFYTKMTPENKDIADSTIISMLKKSAGKFLSDWEVVMKFPTDLVQLRIPTSIQKVESVFSDYRRIESIDNLKKNNQYSSTLFAYNQTSDWLENAPNSEHIIRFATSTRNIDATRQKFNEENKKINARLYQRLLETQKKTKK